ncbi:kinase-like protein [Rhizophagus irregularis]|uniref:Kinase-like protein n=2 Tax=Rhizophagus irregularis TaxID=588596 RepID=A0A2I1EPZ4_9GLOM|nr:kinase-like protein [Rhizophagus irregularis]PKY24196.1 kinase-like protein [Rhizophagus irregularis]CAB4481906.1 unnamed protein product [Rhizophagus irregularis]CAB5302931.1 unnamed protein product [Rhizophagus irregularis]
MALRKMYIKKDEITKNENPIEYNGNKTNVYIGNYKGQDVAIKLSKNDQETTRQEFYTYYRLRSSQNIIKCFGIMSLPNQNLSLIFEYASKGNLHDHLKSSSLTWEEKFKLLNEILLGLDYCHEKHILHLNLKLSNILVTDDGIIKLTDFAVKGGVNKKDDGEKKSFKKDSLCWLAPERICKDENINSWFVKNPYLSDIYSCGLILWSVVCDGKIPYENLESENIEKEKSNVNTIQDLNEKLPKDCPKNYIKVFNNLTKYNPEERCTLSTAVTDLQSTCDEVDEIKESLNSEQIMVESQLKINQQPQEKTEQENIQQKNLDFKKKNEEIINQPRNSVSFPDLKNSAIEALTEQERKERRYSSAELIGDNNSKSFRRSGVSFYEHPINVNSRLINTSFFRSTPSPSPSSKISAAPSVLTTTQQSTISVTSQINFIEELFEFYQSQVRIDLNSFPKQLQYWLKSKQLDPTSLFDSVKNVPSQKFYESLLGILYENGIGTLQDKILAFHCYTMGKDNNDPISKALLANAHLIGCGTKKSVKQAYMLLKKYSNEGNIWCQFMLAEYYYNNTISINCFGKKNLMLRDTSKEAFMWYMKSAQGGYINAEYKIGDCYKKGFGAIKSNLAAFQWYLKAAINGLMIAQYKVAKCYQNGGYDGGIGEKNEKTDEDEAFKWYLRAASNRYEKAMKIVAEGYENGYHIDKDLGEAKRWYEQALLLGLDWAYTKLRQWCDQDIIKSNDPLYYEIMLR